MRVKRPNPLLLIVGITNLAMAQNGVDFWNVERPQDMANIKSLDVMCGKTHMEVQISFDRPYNGIIFSKGAVDQYNCIYVKPQTGASAYSFNIMYNQVRGRSIHLAGPYGGFNVPLLIMAYITHLHCVESRSGAGP